MMAMLRTWFAMPDDIRKVAQVVSGVQDTRHQTADMPVHSYNAVLVMDGCAQEGIDSGEHAIQGYREGIS